jgi:hypothetical protein
MNSRRSSACRSSRWCSRRRAWTGAGFVDDGIAVNSGEYDGLPTAEFKKRITAWLEATGKGEGKVNYKLRDWLFSRQRFWGEPFPLLHCEKCGVVPVPEKDLPVRLPEMNDYRPTADGQPPLARATEWLKATCPSCGGEARRETNTMPQWAGSCWYYLRYIDPKNSRRFVDPAKEKYWMPVDLYVGGAEHAVLHLLYARFWHKVLFDCGAVSTKEPFQRLVNQGMILGEMEYHADPKAFAMHAAALAEQGIEGVEDRKDGDRGIAGGQGPADGRLIGLPDDQVEKRQGKTFVKGHRSRDCRPRREDEQEPRQRDQSGRHREGIRRGFAAALRDVHGAADAGEAVEHEGRRRRLALPEPRLPAGARRGDRGAVAQAVGRRTDESAAARAACRDQEGERRHRGDGVQHGHFRDDDLRERGAGVGDAAAVDAIDVRPAAGAVRAASGGGTVEPAGASGHARVRAVAGVGRVHPEGGRDRNPVQVNGKVRGRIRVAAEADEAAVCRRRWPVRRPRRSWRARRSRRRSIFRNGWSIWWWRAEVRFNDPVFVSADKISIEGMRALKAVAAKLVALKGRAKVVVTGYTDDVPLTKPTDAVPGQRGHRGRARQGGRRPSGTVRPGEQGVGFRGATGEPSAGAVSQRFAPEPAAEPHGDRASDSRALSGAFSTRRSPWPANTYSI